MTALPRISVVTPNYNGARFLEAAIRSVLCQGYTNVQYIVVDGASADGSMEIIDRYKNDIDIVINEPDRGHGDALNKGFARADGQILAWLNSDDMYLPWAFYTVAEIFTRFPHISWIEGVPSFWDECGRLYGTQNVRPINQFDYLLGRYEWIQQESVFWTRNLWQAAGSHIADDYKFMVDGELWTRFFLHSPLHRVEYLLSAYRMHASNRSHDQTKVHQEMTRAIKAMQRAVAPDVNNLVQRFKRMQRWLRIIPSLTLQGGIAGKLAMADFWKMGYNIVGRDKGDLKITRKPFLYNRW